MLPLPLMPDAERDGFERPARLPDASGWPEVGSRALQRLVEQPDEDYPWSVVQDGTYRYQASTGGGVCIRMVISEYLGCQVQWDL